MRTPKSEYHYKIIEEVIEHIVDNRLHPQTLGELASSFSVSHGYLQKIFTRWAGISPKQFSRYLSLQYSKELLLQNKSTTAVVAGSGLSSGGRLHDLFVDIEAMTPGEYQSKGAKLVINYAFLNTRFGLCLVAATSRGICNILFFDSREDARADLSSRWPYATLQEKKGPEHEEVEKYLSGILSKGRVRFCVRGTNFQIKVWEALLSIPEGEIRTYGDIAAELGNRKLSRAVGTAISDNPIGYIIPCHRVLKSTGEISGYRWGINRKRAMLSYEAIRKNEKVPKTKDFLLD